MNDIIRAIPHKVLGISVYEMVIFLILFIVINYILLGLILYNNKLV